MKIMVMMMTMINNKRINNIIKINSNDEKSLSSSSSQAYSLMALRDIGRTSRSSDRETEPVGGKRELPAAD